MLGVNGRPARGEPIRILQSCLVATTILLSAAAALHAQAAQVVASVPATDAQQREFELIAATALAVQFQKYNPDHSVLDVRLYSAWYDRAGPPPKTIADYTSSASSAHTASHMQAVSRLLGIATIVADSVSCVAADMNACRMGEKPSLVAFSPALIRGDTAFIAVKRATRSSRSVGIHAWRVLLVGAAGSWMVRNMSTIIID